jgi:beta-galactosidase
MHSLFWWKLKINEFLSDTVRHYLMENISPSIIGIFAFLYALRFNDKTRQKSNRLTNGSERKVNEFSNPKIIGRKRRQMHHKSKSFFKLKEANQYWYNKSHKIVSPSNDVMMLTGKAGMPESGMYSWKFSLVGCNNGYPIDDWVNISYNDENWSEIAMPGHWQLQGFDVPIYTNTMYPFTFDPPFAIREGTWRMTDCDAGLQKYFGTSGPLHRNEPKENAVGLYRKSFQLPDEWTSNAASCRIFLVFEGAGSSLTVFLDGNFVGFSKDSCLPVEFDVTDILAKDNYSNVSHTLAAKVTRWCDASYLEDQDTWWLSGIYREVYLIRKPREFISDIEISTTIADNGQGVIHCAVLAEGVKEELHAIRIALMDFSGNEVAAYSQVLNYGESEFQRGKEANCIYDPRLAENELVSLDSPGTSIVELRVNYPILWNAESPYLYRIYVTLYPTISEALIGDHQGLHTETLLVGIRKVDIGGPNHCLRINNEPITIAGVNRSEFDPHHGRAVSREAMRADAILLKSMNFNAVRSSHYPQHPYWLDVCDEIGLYVIDEANIETHGFQAQGNPTGYLSNEVEWRGAMFNRVTRMFERDKNHACVIGWSLGNEAGFGTTHDLMAQWLRTRDPFRFVQYESGGARTTATDIICPMYKGVAWCQYQSLQDPKRRPVILCEYAHAMGNSGGALSKYWAAFRDERYPRLQGGFIWDLVDQGLWCEEKQGFVFGGDFDEVPHTGNFCINGLVSPDRKILFPDMLETAFLQSPVSLSLEINASSMNLVATNHRSFADLSDLMLQCHLRVHHHAFQPAFACPTFAVELGKIAPSQKSRLDILTSLKRSIGNVKGIVLQSLMTHDTWFSCFPCQAYLDVTIIKKASSSYWSTKDLTLLHTTLTADSSSAFLDLINEFVASQSDLAVVDSSSASSSEPFANKEKLQVMNEEAGFRIRWPNGSEAYVLAQDGSLSSWKDANGNALLMEPLRICLHRAPTDNDKGGADFSYAAFWSQVDYAGMQLSQPPTMMAIELDSEGIGGLQILCRGEMVSQEKLKTTGVRIPWEASYIFRSNGGIDVTISVRPEKGLPWLPRVGLRFAVSRQHYQQVRWYGKGPHESYGDRCSSVYVDVFEQEIDKMHTPYIYPQENGHRLAPRWIVLQPSADTQSPSIPALAMLPCVHSTSVDTSSNTSGLEQGDVSRYGFSVSPYSLEVLEHCQHEYELPVVALARNQEDRYYVHIDSRMMGVGGVDSWSRNVEDTYLIVPDGQALVTEVRLQPLP